LEKSYKIQERQNHIRFFTDAYIFSAALLLFFGVYAWFSGATIIQLQILLPSAFLLVAGILFRNSKSFFNFSQVYIVFTMASLSLLVTMQFEQSGAPYLVLSLIFIIMSGRAPIELPTFCAMTTTLGVLCLIYQLDLNTTAMLFMGFAASLALWLWREDMQRRQFLQFCAPVQLNKIAQAPKETERARQLVVLDKYTGLANNTSFMRFFTNEWRRAFRARQSVSLILIALEASVQKLTEHGQLEKVLTELQRYSRRPGDLVGKIDDYTFGVLLSNTDIANSRKLAESLLGHLHGLDLGQDGQLKVFMGVASTLPMPSMTHEDLYNKAFEALMAAREKPSQHASK